MASSKDLEEFKTKTKEILENLDQEASFVLLSLKGDVNSEKPMEQSIGGTFHSRSHCQIAILFLLTLVKEQATHGNDMEFVGQIVGLQRAIENLFELKEEKTEEKGETVH